MNQNEKLLIFKSDVDSFETYMTEGMRREGIDVIPLSVFQSGGPLIRRVIHKYRKFKSMDLTRYSRIIVFGDDYIYSLLRARRKRIKSVLWIWNTLPERRMIRWSCRLFRKWGTAFTFDQQDQIKYGLRRNTQFYVYPQESDSELIQRDVYFVGKDKGRKSILEELAVFFEEKGITFQFQVKPDSDSEWSSSRLQKVNWVDYKAITQNIRESNVILEICKECQEGMTLRTMEAIFYDKKLITNNLSYENYSFFDPERIYIIKDNDYSGLVEFIRSETPVKYEKKYKDYYDVRAWAERFWS